MAGVPERGLKPSSGWNTLQNVEVEVFGGLLGSPSLSDHHLCSCKGAQCDGVPDISVPNSCCCSSLLSTLRRRWDHRRQRSQTSGTHKHQGHPLELHVWTEVPVAKVPWRTPTPLCSPGLLWVVKGWEVHQTHLLILGSEPRFQWSWQV